MSKAQNTPKPAAVWDQVSAFKRQKIMQGAVAQFYARSYLPTTMDDTAASERDCPHAPRD